MALSPKEIIENGAVVYLKKLASQNGEKLSFFIDAQGSSTEWAGNPADALPISQEAYAFIKQSIGELDKQLAVSLAVVDDKSLADIVIMKHDYDVSGGDYAGFNWYSYSYYGSAKNPSSVQFEYNDISVNTVYGEDTTNFWKYTLLHELGHSIGLEHPFDFDDGDGYGTEESTSVDQTLMAYGQPKDGTYPLDFKTVDIEALQSIWGKPISTAEPSSVPAEEPSSVPAEEPSSVPAEEPSLNILSNIDDETIPLSTLAGIDWSTVDTSTFSAKTYAQLDWSIVNISDIKGVSLSALNWSLIKVGDLQTEELKKLDWSAVDTSTFSDETYSQLNWSTVTIGAFTQESKKTLDWSKVKVGGEDGLIEESLSTTDLLQISLGTDISSVNFKKTDWNSVSFGEFSSQSYQAIEWSQIKMNKLNSSTYSTIDWSEVEFGEFTKKQYKQTNWSQIDFEDFQSEDYNEVNWSQVKFKGSKAPNVAELDMSLVVEADTFSKKNAKQINWGQLSTDDLSSDALSKLEGFNVKKKGVNVADLLVSGTQSNAVSFAGVDGGGAAWTTVALPETADILVSPIGATGNNEWRLL